MEIQAGQVVEFLEGGRFTVALVLGTKGTRLHLFTHLGRETNLSKNRLIHVSSQRISPSPREEALARLKEIHEKRDSIKDEVDIEEVWELLEGEQEIWNPREFAQTIFGESASPDHEAAVIRAVLSERTHFKFKDGFIRAQSRENVERLLEQRKREEERLRRIEEGQRLLKAIWDGGVKNGVEIDSDLASDWIETIKAFCLYGEEAERASEVKDLFRKLGLHSPSAPFETLVRAGVWSEDENIELLRAEIERDFPEDVLKEAEEIEDSYNDVIRDSSFLHDHLSLDCFTIDAEESKDLDDALSIRSVENGIYEVGIHITDVGLFIRPGMRLFDFAIERATSIYLPDEIITMLPETLCNNTFSLLPERKRASLSFFVLLDEDANILDKRVERSIISSKKRLSYDEADELIRVKGPIKQLYDLALKLQKKRIVDGNALPLPIPELNIRVEEGEIKVWLDEPGPARFLVSELMILANWVAATMLRDNSIPALYRSQPEPRDRIIEGSERDLKSNYRQRRLISRGVLGPEPDFHSGLGLDCYTTITSPIRRALDLLMQLQLEGFITNGKPEFSLKELEKLSITLQEGLIRAAGVRNARFRYWLLKHLATRKDEDLKAWVLDILDTKLLLVLDDYLLTVEIPKEHKMEYHLDQEVNVRIKKVNPRENNLKFEWGGFSQ